MRGAEWPQEPGRERDSAAHQRVGANGVGVAAPIVPIVAFINICANLRAVWEKCSPGALPCGQLCPFLPSGICPPPQALHHPRCPALQRSQGDLAESHGSALTCLLALA